MLPETEKISGKYVGLVDNTINLTTISTVPGAKGKEIVKNAKGAGADRNGIAKEASSHSGEAGCRTPEDTF